MFEYPNKEIRFLVTSIANLPRCSSEDYNNHSLACGIIRHIFLSMSRLYLDDLLTVFNELNKEQQENFIEYYNLQREEARVNGFLVDYDSIKEYMTTHAKKIGLKKIWLWVSSLSFLAISLFSVLTLFSDHPSSLPLILVAAIWIASYFSEKIRLVIQANSVETLRLSDLIYRQNKEYIEKVIKGNKYIFKEAGLLDKDGNIKIDIGQHQDCTTKEDVAKPNKETACLVKEERLTDENVKLKQEETFSEKTTVTESGANKEDVAKSKEGSACPLKEADLIDKSEKSNIQEVLPEKNNPIEQITEVKSENAPLPEFFLLVIALMVFLVVCLPICIFIKNLI